MEYAEYPKVSFKGARRTLRRTLDVLHSKLNVRNPYKHFCASYSGTIFDLVVFGVQHLWFSIYNISKIIDFSLAIR